MSTLSASHFWDCNGGACDAPTLDPWIEYIYSYAPHYAPQLPPNGIGEHGESLWLTGAASDALSTLLGASDPCCGRDVDSSTGDVRGGCGKCMLVRNPSAAHNLTAVIMKKSRCPPENNLCRDNPHIDIAAPGFDFAAASTAFVCGSSSRRETYLTPAEGRTCGDATWTGTLGTCCAAMDASTPAKQRLRNGCDLFASWGWTTGTPMLDLLGIVECPAEFKARVSAAFQADGVVPMLAPPPQPPSPPSPPTRPPYPPFLPMHLSPPSPPPEPSTGLTPNHALVMVVGGVVAFVICLVFCRPSCGRRNGRPQTVSASGVRGTFRSRNSAPAEISMGPVAGA